MSVQVLRVKVHGQEAALKLMGAQNCSMSARDRAAAERELSIMRSLHHPCIVQVLPEHWAWGTEVSSWALVTRLVISAMNMQLLSGAEVHEEYTSSLQCPGELLHMSRHDLVGCRRLSSTLACKRMGSSRCFRHPCRCLICRCTWQTGRPYRELVETLQREVLN